MKTLIEKLQTLKQSSVQQRVHQRIKEFKTFQHAPSTDIFHELCFCLMTASCPAERCMRIQQELRDEFLTFSAEELEKSLRSKGYRFPNRAPRITHARKQVPQLSQQLSTSCGKIVREWLVTNVTGLGYKEASHFLRNIGYDDVAIIDVHIIRLLVSYDVIDEPRTLTKKRYLEIEQTLEMIAKKTQLTLAELDLYLWYMQTGKILK